MSNEADMTSDLSLNPHYHNAAIEYYSLLQQTSNISVVQKTGTLTYQWRRKFEHPGCNSAYLFNTATTASDSGSKFRVNVTTQRVQMSNEGDIESLRSNYHY